jgi:hypothetical protein
MKKNRMMRVASVLLVAVLLTTSPISGTFAKYVTKTSANDTARVAKWGVTLATGGTLFGTEYQKHTTDSGAGEITNTVVVDSSGNNIVAPGTSSNDLNDGAATYKGLNFSVTGTPEVAVKVSFSVADGWKDIVLPAAEGYTDYTTYPTTGTFDVDADYHPLKFTLCDKDNTPISGYSNVPLETIVNYLNGTSSDLYFPANTNLATALGTYTLYWKWDFSVDDTTDKYDTFLGQRTALGTAVTLPEAAASKFSNEVSIAITVTVTQID